MISMIAIETDEDHAQFQLLNSAIGEASSGMKRYAAAMYFFMRDMISEDELEIYRTCAKLDHEDPRQFVPGPQGRSRL